MEADVAGLFDSSGDVYDPATGQGLKGLFNPKEYSIDKSVQWEPHKSPGLRVGDGIDEDCNGHDAKYGAVAGAHRNDDLVCGDGYDEDCNGHDLCVSSPYATPGGDPLNVRAPRVRVTKD